MTLEVTGVTFLRISRYDYFVTHLYTPEARNTLLCPSRWRNFVIHVRRMTLLDVGRLWEACNVDSGHHMVPLEKRCGVNLLKPTGYVMHQQFNSQQLYVLPTLYLCVLYLSESKQRLVPLTAQTDWFL